MQQSKGQRTAKKGGGAKRERVAGTRALGFSVPAPSTLSVPDAGRSDALKARQQSAAIGSQSQQPPSFSPRVFFCFFHPPVSRVFSHPHNAPHPAYPFWRFPSALKKIESAAALPAPLGPSWPPRFLFFFSLPLQASRRHLSRLISSRTPWGALSATPARRGPLWRIPEALSDKDSAKGRDHTKRNGRDKRGAQLQGPEQAAEKEEDSAKRKRQSTTKPLVKAKKATEASDDKKNKARKRTEQRESVQGRLQQHAKSERKSGRLGGSVERRGGGSKGKPKTARHLR